MIGCLECRWWFFPATGLAAHMGGDSLDPPTQVTMHWLVGDICIILTFVFVWCVICICVMWHLHLWDVTFVFVWGDTQPTYTGHHAPASRRCVLHNETQTVTVEYPWWWSCWFWSSSLADSRTSSFFVRYQQKKWYVCRIFWPNFCFQTERLWETKWLTKPKSGQQMCAEYDGLYGHWMYFNEHFTDFRWTVHTEISIAYSAEYWRSLRKLVRFPCKRLIDPLWDLIDGFDTVDWFSILQGIS